MEQKTVSSMVIGDAQTYRNGLLYWGVIAIVVSMFLVTTINYYYGTLTIIEESNRAIPMARPSKPVYP